MRHLTSICSLVTPKRWLLTKTKVRVPNAMHSSKPVPCHPRHSHNFLRKYKSCPHQKITCSPKPIQESLQTEIGARRRRVLLSPISPCLWTAVRVFSQPAK